MMHIGGVRTALFNWIFARQTGGKFILRIEDTDRKRYDPQALDSIKAALKWLGLGWDEGPDVGGEHGPYFQSERREIYERYAKRLTQSGAAYYCDCDSERLEQMRARQKAEKAPPGYDGHCRERNLTPTNAAAKAMAVRFKVPRAGEISFADEIHGKLTFALNTINDFIILKAKIHNAQVCPCPPVARQRPFKIEQTRRRGRGSRIYSRGLPAGRHIQLFGVARMVARRRLFAYRCLA